MRGEDGSFFGGSYLFRGRGGSEREEGGGLFRIIEPERKMAAFKLTGVSVCLMTLRRYQMLRKPKERKGGVTGC